MVLPPTAGVVKEYADLTIIRMMAMNRMLRIGADDAML